MAISRREMLRILAASPLAFTGGCCTATYPRAMAVMAMAGLPAPRPILAPKPRAVGADSGGGRVIDVHAHFFNASDVPVRDFIAKCLGHSASPIVQRLLRAISPLADLMAERAPTAADEIGYLQRMLVDTAARDLDDAQASAQATVRTERQAAAERVSAVIRGSEFERLYRQYKWGSAVPVAGGLTSADAILTTVSESEAPSGQVAVVASQPVEAVARSQAADGMLGFLYYMLSYRSNNVDAYIEGFRRHERAFGVDMVLGSLVDFDYWLDCPPRSAHDDQVELHALLAQLHGGFLRPIVAYNPWTDIEQDGAGLARVKRSVKDLGFVGVKIYPPTGFMPAANATTIIKTKKRRPDLRRLDAVLETFFDTCADLRVPVIAHANRSNGRDQHHDDFSSPASWRKMLARYDTRPEKPIVDVGHFGGGAATSDWTNGFATLMAEMPKISLYGDLGFWDELMCVGGSPACDAAKMRLKAVLQQPVGADTVADRVMFGSDWLMLSQVKSWADYPSRLNAAIAEIAPAAVSKILGGNAAHCFSI